jgi:hypothetical protein
MGKKPSTETWCSRFCGKKHRVRDGKPVGHECFVLPAEAVFAESRGDDRRAASIMALWKDRRPHKGIKG